MGFKSAFEGLNKHGSEETLQYNIYFSTLTMEAAVCSET